jgi:hypothetical protein
MKLNYIPTVLAWMFGLAVVALIIAAMAHGNFGDGKGVDPAVLEAIGEAFDALGDD